MSLASANMHLDPDFENLTYGDSGTRRGKGLTDLDHDDFIVFYSGVKPESQTRIERPTVPLTAAESRTLASGESRQGFRSAGVVAFLTRETCEGRRQPLDDNVSCIIKAHPVSLRQHVGSPKSENVGLELLDHVHSRSEITSIGSV